MTSVPLYSGGRTSPTRDGRSNIGRSSNLDMDIDDPDIDAEGDDEDGEGEEARRRKYRKWSVCVKKRDDVRCIRSSEARYFRYKTVRGNIEMTREVRDYYQLWGVNVSGK